MKEFLLDKKPQLRKILFHYNEDMENIAINSGIMLTIKCDKCGSIDQRAARVLYNNQEPCAYCTLRKINHTNCVATTNPEILEEWAHEKNSVTPYEISRSYRKQKIYWCCKNCKSYYKSDLSSKIISLKNRSVFRGCPYCSGRKVNNTNNVLTIPLFRKEWNYNLNNIDPNTVHKGAHRRVWWNCSKCTSVFEAEVNTRLHSKNGCPYCSKQKINHTNCLGTTHPKISATLYDSSLAKVLHSGSNKVVKWKCENNHIWKTMVTVRTKDGAGCPYCANFKTWEGYNDIATTHPQHIDKFLRLQDTKTHTAGSGKKVEAKCPSCNLRLGRKTVKNIIGHGVSCSRCDDGVSYGEKLVSAYLIKNQIQFEMEKTFSWQTAKRYDFYLPQFKTIIEVHGIQHYEDGIFFNSFNSAKQQQENDKSKMESALANGIKHYITLNASKITEKVFLHELWKKLSTAKIYTNYELEEIVAFSQNSWVLHTWKLYNQGREVQEIVLTIPLSEYTIRRYLRLGKSLGKLRN